MNHTQKTFLLSPEEKESEWYIIDAKGKVLGRLASEVAKVLRGKHRPDYTPNTGGAGVIIINAKDIVVTGNKPAQKIYFSHTGFFGGQKSISLEDQMRKDPTKVIYDAVWGMMPVKTRLARKQMTRLRVFAADKHDMHAQQPIKANI